MSLTGNGHVRWKCVPIQCQPSHKPQRTPRTTSSSAPRPRTRSKREPLSGAPTRASSRSASACPACAMRSQYHSCRVAPMPLDPSRTVAELRELQELTGDENGAQRVAWTDTWERAREWLRGKVAALPLDEQIDQAGNQWFTLPGAAEQALLIGGHIDSVPNGGRLGGCPNPMARGAGLRAVC